MLDVAVQREMHWPDRVAWDDVAKRAVNAAVSRTPYAQWIGLGAVIEVSVRLTDNREVQALNAQYRHKDKPTNVLSFPLVQRDLLETVTLNSDDGEVLLGDIILAHGVCEAEAEERNIGLVAHATHLIVHGTLHLLGYDHEGEAEAEAMEDIERVALSGLGLHDPYPIRED